jgi:hypothetical protein
MSQQARDATEGDARIYRIATAIEATATAHRPAHTSTATTMIQTWRQETETETETPRNTAHPCTMLPATPA